MRLAVEVTTCTTSRTGIGYYTQHLVDALLETRPAGDDLVLISNRPPAPELAARWAGHLRVAGSRVRALWMQLDAPGLLSAAGADVAAFPNYVMPVACPCPAIVFVHDLALLRMPELFTLRKRAIMRPFLRESVGRASRVATVSQASRRDILDLLGTAEDRLALLPGAPHPSCGPASPAAVAAVRARHGLERPYVLTVGTLEPRKNLLTLLAAFDALGTAAAALDLVVVGGRGWHDRDLVQALGERRPLGHVRWLGYVAEEELVGLYGGAELFVYPSRFEGFGLPVVEAMACGTPVVASDVPALREVGADAALFVPPGDPGALASAMRRLLTDEAAARHARERGRERARAFSWTRTASTLWELARETGPHRLPRPAAVEPPPAPGLPPPLGTPPAGLRARQWALLATVAYADLFDAPLPVEEAVAACIGTTIDEAELRRLVKGPALAGLVTLHPDGQLVLAGREELVARRQEGAVRTEALLARHRAVLGAVASLPFVRMAAFSGGTVHQNPGTKPDIDLFVVAAPGHVYTVYALLFLASKLTRTRHIVCPNYLVDENELTIAFHHDLFTAHQLVSARPLSGARTYQAFCRANEPWVRAFFDSFRARPTEGVVEGGWVQRAGEVALFPVALPLERLLRWGWRTLLRRRAARASTPDVVLADGILKLHLSDYRRRVLERFARRLDELRAKLTTPAEHEGSAVGARAVRP